MTLVKNPEPSSPSTTKTQPVEFLILGAGWSSTFLIPLLQESNIVYAATTTTGRDKTIPFKFDSTSPDQGYFSILPSARTILITFPLTGSHQSKILTTSYLTTHLDAPLPNFIQLGSTGIWGFSGDASKRQDWVDEERKSPWLDRHSKYDKANPRAVAEDELLDLGGVVLNLSGLWGGERRPWNFVPRVAGTKEQCRGKASLHMIHGYDVARGILAVHKAPSFPSGTRWMLTDMMVYDWWALLLRWGDGTGIKEASAGSGFQGQGEGKGKQREWVRELMDETGTKALPRGPEVLARCYDSREFWKTFGLEPVRAGL